MRLRLISGSACIVALMTTFAVSVTYAGDGHRSSYFKDGKIQVNVLGQPEGKPITKAHWDFRPPWSIAGDHLVFFRRLKNDPVVSNWITKLCIINVDDTGFHPLSGGTHVNGGEKSWQASRSSFTRTASGGVSRRSDWRSSSRIDR